MDKNKQTHVEIEIERQLAEYICMAKGYIYCFLPEKEIQVTVSSFHTNINRVAYVPFYWRTMRLKVY